jgi:hypothetical protein
VAGTISASLNVFLYNQLKMQLRKEKCTMKYLFSMLFFPLLYLVSQTLDPSKGLSDRSRASHQLIGKFGKQMEEKYGFHPCAFGGGATEEGIWLFSIHFDYYHEPMLIDQARRLIVSCAEEFLELINSSEEIRPYLKNYPSTAKNIEIHIYFTDIDRKKIYDPYLTVVSINEGIIRYKTEEEGNSFEYKSNIRESYEEALDILKKERLEK